MQPFENQTPESIRSRVLARMETDLQTREGSYSYDMASPLSFELWRVLMTLGEFISAFYVDESSGPYLDSHAKLLGMERRQGTKAHASIHFSGSDGVVIPAGTAFFTAGGLQYALTETAAIQNGSAVGVAEAAEVGAAYNVDPGEINQILRNISGLTSFTSEAAAGGADSETDAALFQRIDHHRKNPCASGNENHYKEWALSCDGIGGVKVTGLWNGPGTVRVLVSGYDYQPVDGAVVEACAQYIQAQRPVGADVTVLSAGNVSVDVSGAVVLDGSASLETVKETFSTALKEYLQSVTAAYFKDHETYPYLLYYKRIAALLMCVEGVVDYTELTVNGGTENVAIDGAGVPTLGGVVFT